MICDSQSDLPSTFAAISPKVWHDWLGESGVPILDVLRQNKSIACNRLSSSNLC